MDEIVEAALRKWPDVPACHGWLALDARGDWYLRDAQSQAAGPFPAIKGSRIEHDRLREFIERNYAVDPVGRWFFQNGPQRVYVELEAAPWVWRLQDLGPELQVRAHTGEAVRVSASWLDESDRLFLATELGLGIVHSQDMLLAAGAVESGAWVPQSLAFAVLPDRFGYRLRPAPTDSARKSRPAGAGSGRVAQVPTWWAPRRPMPLRQVPHRSRQRPVRRARRTSRPPCWPCRPLRVRSRRR